MSEESFLIAKGLQLSLQRSVVDGMVQLDFRLPADKTSHVLHWAVADNEGGQWKQPAEIAWPEGSKPHAKSAVQSPFRSIGKGQELTLRFLSNSSPPFVVFDLYAPETGRWMNNGGKDYWVRLAELGPSPTECLKAQLATKRKPDEDESKNWPLDGGGELAVAVERLAESITVTMVTDVAGEVFLHWGIQDRSRAKWKQPVHELWPIGSSEFDQTAVRSPFEQRDGLGWLTLHIPSEQVVSGLGFLLYESESGRWIKHRRSDFFLKFTKTASDEAPLDELAERIVDGEMGPHGWTLMHRFNLCQELIDQAGESRDAWATLFVWLRFSAIRQLDWQRNYNTKPRELAHAQDRLTEKLAESFARFSEVRDFIRLMMGCVGRGGDGQRIRDEILHIMHRHHIKEVGGTWMEQWHQKLHNNTTPDDIVICEAYLAFLRGNGDLQAYDSKLGEGGVTRGRLADFERPITQNPEWHPHLRDGLLHDFENYVKLLRSVHSGTDLETAENRGNYLLDEGGRGALGYVRWHFGNPDTGLSDLVARITEVRCQLSRVLAHESNSHRVKDGLYLDLALEEALRTVIERNLHSVRDGESLLMLVEQVLTNLLTANRSAELDQCARELDRLPDSDRFGRDWSLRAKAVLDRLARTVQDATDTTYQLLQPIAERLGRAFEADEWTVKLFSEEIVRGRPLFVLSMLLHHLDPILRRSAHLGDWQVISPSRAVGFIMVVGELRSVQSRRFDRPTIIIADRVHGDEEPPDGVHAVLTSASVDLVSHVAVRARNANVLFATCHDTETFANIRRMEGKYVELAVNSGGDVVLNETVKQQTDQKLRRGRRSPQLELPEPSLRVLQQKEFDRKWVGAKSRKIRELSEQLRGRFQTPRSIAIPFEVFDAVLSQKCNSAQALRYRSLLRELSIDKLQQICGCIMELDLPQELLENLEVAITQAGLQQPSDVDTMAARIKQVWASLWNDRAYLSREFNGLPHDQACMAVLIQKVVSADYAFVVHTVNPSTGNRDELYGEVVQGLGETLVGNYPGRAMSFVTSKTGSDIKITAYPSKSVALRGGGLIFRSDSNVEDLEGYAGAGLYDSVLLDPPREELADYTADRLIWDGAFQGEVLHGITSIGVEVEKAFGDPQDIEGAWVDGQFHVVQTRPQVGIR